MSTVKEYKCPNCGAPLEFNPTTQNWKCHYCLSEHKEDEFDTIHKEEAPLEDMPELDSYTCSSCGAELIADNNTSATFCVYCKSPAIIKTRFSGKFRPKNVIPFKLTKKEAVELYRNWIQKKLFAPGDFKKKEEIEKVTGIYAPFWLFDCNTDGSIKGEGTKVRSWRQGDYMYTERKYYSVSRKGLAKYVRVPVDGSKKLDDKYMQLMEPYNYNDLTAFSMKYMSGFMAEKYDVESAEGEKIMKARVDAFIEQRLRSTVTGYSSFSLSNKEVLFKDIEASYSMLPIYLMINRYKGKEHVFIVNGQSGKVVGDTPISFLKQLLFAFGIFAGVWIIAVFGGALFV